MGKIKKELLDIMLSDSRQAGRLEAYKEIALIGEKAKSGEEFINKVLDHLKSVLDKDGE